MARTLLAAFVILFPWSMGALYCLTMAAWRRK